MSINGPGGLTVRTVEAPRIGYETQGVLQVVRDELTAAAHSRYDDNLPFLCEVAHVKCGPSDLVGRTLPALGTPLHYQP